MAVFFPEHSLFRERGGQARGKERVGEGIRRIYGRMDGRGRGDIPYPGLFLPPFTICGMGGGVASNPSFKI